MRFLAFLFSLLLSGSLLAQAYPLREVRLIVPLPEGGASDAIARLLGEKLAEAMGQPVRVENRAAGAGAVGADAVAKSPPDGYTLLAGTSSTHAIGPAVNPRLPYTPADFTPVALVATFPTVLVAPASVPSLAALLDVLKANPGKYAFGSAGAATPGHFAGELFKQMTQSEVRHTAYAGIGELIEAVAAGRVAFAFEQLAALGPALQAGRVRALGVGSLERNPALPDVPAVTEALSGFEAAAWLGLFAPPRTPAEIIARLQGEVRGIVQMSDVAQRLRQLGATPAGLAPDAFAAFVLRDAERWRTLAENARLRAGD